MNVNTPNTPTPLRRLSAGARFRDISGQTFEALGQTRIGWRRRKFYGVRCLTSPFTSPLGPISSAFFTSPGAVLWLDPYQPVEVLP